MVERTAARTSVPARAPRTEAGFTVVECLVAMVILMIAILSIALLFERGLKTSRDTRSRVVAAQLASQAIETLRGPAADPAKFTNVIDPVIGQTVSTRKVNGLTYTVTQDAQWVSQSSSTSLCDAGTSSNAQLVQVSESITWTNMGGTKPVRSVTTLAPPVGAYSSSSGAIAVKVLDASGQPVPSIDVGITGTASDTQSTTAQGCAFFDHLPSGPYTVTVIDSSGIGDQEQLAPSQTASVVVGQITPRTFNYDRAATLNLAGWAITGWPYATATLPATNIPVSVANSGLQPYFQFAFPSASATYPTGVGTVGPVYPYASGYVVFAGNCRDSNPLGKDGSNNAFYPTASPPIVATSAGATASSPVPLYTVAAAVKNGGVAVPAATVTATPTAFAAPYNAVCTNGGSSGTGATIGLVSSDVAGLSTTAIPLGHWTLKAVSGTKSGVANVWVKPDGVYLVDNAGVATTKLSGPVTIAIL